MQTCHIELWWPLRCRFDTCLFRASQIGLASVLSKHFAKSMPLQIPVLSDHAVGEHRPASDARVTDVPRSDMPNGLASSREGLLPQSKPTVLTFFGPSAPPKRMKRWHLLHCSAKTCSGRHKPSSRPSPPLVTSTHFISKCTVNYGA
jgi:hypothetical protein